MTDKTQTDRPTDFLPHHHVCFLLNNEFVFDNRVRREAETLANSGLQVSVLCVAADQLPTHDAKHTPTLHQPWQVHRIISKRLNKFDNLSNRTWRTFLRILWHYKRIGKPVFTAVHAHDANTLFLGWLLSRCWRVPLIYDSHEYWSALFEEQAQTLALRLQEGKLRPKDYQQQLKRLNNTTRLEQWLLARCDAIITVGHHIASQLQTHAIRSATTARLQQHVKHMPVVVVPNAWELTPQPELPLPKRFHDAYQLPSDAKVILYQGQIAYKRGLGILIEAMEHLEALSLATPTASTTNLALVLMGPVLPGDAPFVAEMQARVAQSPWLAQRVFFKPSVPPNQLLSWTQCANLGIHPILNTGANHYYCLPNKLFEYVQAGLPVGLSAFPEMKALVDAHHLGFTFDPHHKPQLDTPETLSLAHQLLQFFADPHTEENTRKAVAAAKLTLCWEAQEATLVDVYRQVLV
jgi:glycosyltransferase involved in cell wall biosynthesis